MQVQELRALLGPEIAGDREVIVRCRWHGEAPAHDVFDLAYVTMVLEPDTAESVVVLECRQDGMP